MIHNIIGPPGSGKTTYIREHFGLAPPMRTIDATVMAHFIRNKVFEHTGLNPKINAYLAGCGEPVITVWLQTSLRLCIARIAKDFFSRKTSLRQTRSRIRILMYYHRHREAVYIPSCRPDNELLIIPSESAVARWISKRFRRIPRPSR